MHTPAAFSNVKNQNLSDTEFQELVRARAKYKERSHATHNNKHKPELELLLQAATENPGVQSIAASCQPAVLFGSSAIERFDITGTPSNSYTTSASALVGDSMLERFSTTGRNIHAKVFERPRTFNAGVGGDKIENLLYRIDLGLLELLRPVGVMLWVVHIGTNNLKRKIGLRPQDISDFRLIVQALLRVSPSSAKILVVGIFRRKDIDDAIVEQSNRSLDGLVRSMNGAFRQERIQFQPEPVGMNKDDHLEDHVHLNDEGYRIWDVALFEKMEEMTRSGTTEATEDVTGA